jgi:hypothetical protein
MFNERELLEKSIEPNSPLKKYIVDYVGGKTLPENDEVTVEMVINILSEDFPEIVLALAEENFFRGYQQGLEDSHHPLEGNLSDDIQE